MKRSYYSGSVTHHACMRLTLKLLYVGCGVLTVVLLNIQSSGMMQHELTTFQRNVLLSASGSWHFKDSY